MVAWWLYEKIYCKTFWEKPNQYWFLCFILSPMVALFIEAYIPDSKVHGANMGPTWVLSSPDGPLVGPMNLAIMFVTWVERIVLLCSKAVDNRQRWAYVSKFDKFSGMNNLKSKFWNEQIGIDTLEVDPSEIDACDISSAVKPMLHVWAARRQGETEHNEIWHATWNGCLSVSEWFEISNFLLFLFCMSKFFTVEMNWYQHYNWYRPPNCALWNDDL